MYIKFFFFSSRRRHTRSVSAFLLNRSSDLFRKFSAFHDETGRLNVDGMNIISNDGSNKLNRSRKARVSYKVQRTINASSTQRRARERSVAIQTLLLVRKSKSSSVKS